MSAVDKGGRGCRGGSLRRSFRGLFGQGGLLQPHNGISHDADDRLDGTVQSLGRIFSVDGGFGSTTRRFHVACSRGIHRGWILGDSGQFQNLGKDLERLVTVETGHTNILIVEQETLIAFFVEVHELELVLDHLGFGRIRCRQLGGRLAKTLVRS